MGKHGTYIIAKNTKGDGKIDDSQEVYDFLKGIKEDDKLTSILSYLATKEELNAVEATFVASHTVRNIVTLTQAEYDLITPDTNTLYNIVEP